MINAAVRARVDAFDPIKHAEFDLQPVQCWRITWPDGTCETIAGHFTQRHGDIAVAFHWIYLGAHRIINLAHVRDIALLSPDEPAR